MLVRFTSIIATVSLLAAAVSAKGQIAQVVDATDFCVFLPPSDSTDRIISNTEWNANVFCLGNTPLAKGAEKLPDGFIKSAHYVKTDAYVQVTGQMDYTKANLVATDEGGQMDIRAPMGSSCAGWKYYVNLIEPVSNTYCMRCCNDDRTCNRGISEKGCAHIIPGDYSGPNDGTGSGAITTTTTTTTTTTGAASTTAADTTITSTSLIASTTPTTLATTNPPSSSVVPSSSSITTPNAVVPNKPNNSPAASSSDQTVSEQSVDNAASLNKPASLVIGLLVVSAAVLA